MTSVVIDTNVFIAAGWSVHARARRVFAGAARRLFRVALTAEILAEYEKTSRRFPEKNYSGLFSWLSTHGVFVEASPLGKQRSRDPTDDMFIACALASGAKTIVSDDNDLLEMQKPFGIEIVSSAEFLARHRL